MFAAIILTLAVFAVGLRALSRPLSEILVDILYAIAQRAYAGAVASDRALVAYRTTHAQAVRDTVREYRSLAARSAGNEALAAGAAVHERADVASVGPKLEVA